MPSFTISARVHRVAISVFFFISGVIGSSWASRVLSVKDKFHLSEGGLGLALFAVPLGQVTGLPLSAWLIARYGSRRIIISAAIAFPLALMGLGLAPTPWMLGVNLYFYGLCANLLNIGINTQAVAVERLYGRSIIASFHGIWSLASFGSGLMGGLFITAGFTPFGHFSLIAGFAIFTAALTYKYVLAESVEPGSSRPAFAKPDKRILLLGLTAFCSMLCEGAVANWSGVYFKKILNAPVSLTILGYVAFMSMMSLGRFTGDRFITRFGITLLLRGGGTLICTGFVLIVTASHIAMATIGFFLVGLGASCVVPMIYGLAGKSKTMQPSMALTAVSTIGFLGFLIGPPVLGFIAQLSNLRWSFAFVACLGFCIMLLAGKIKEE